MLAATTRASTTVDDGSYSHIACGPNSLAPKVIVGVFHTVRLANGKTAYVVHARLAHSIVEWSIQRRYSEFLDLRDDLVSHFARCMVPQCFGCRWFSQSLDGFAFPRRRVLRSNTTDVIAHRKSALDQFARLLASHAFSSIPKCVACSKLPFERVRDFFLTGDSAIIPIHHDIIIDALRVENFSAIADPSKSKIEFRRGRGIVKMVQVEKPVHVRRTSLMHAVREQCDHDQRKSAAALNPPQRRLSLTVAGQPNMAALELVLEMSPQDPPQRSNGATTTTTIVMAQEIYASDSDSDDDDVLLTEADDTVDELDMTGIEIDISTSSSTRHRLAPLRDVAPMATTAASLDTTNLWEPQDFPPPAMIKTF